MNKKIIIGIVVVVIVIILAVLGYFIFNKSESNNGKITSNGKI